MMSPKFEFGDMVVVKDERIGMIVNFWADNSHDVFMGKSSGIQTYNLNELRHYGKNLTDDENGL